MTAYILYGILIVLAVVAVVLGLVVVHRQRDVRRFEPMFERLLAESRIDTKTRETMRQMREVAKDHFRDDTWR